MAPYSAAHIARVFEAHALPFAPITKPQDLFEDAHLLASGGLCPMTLPDGRETQTVLLPLMMDGQRLGVHRSPPQLGEHNASLLTSLGYSPEQIESLSPR